MKLNPSAASIVAAPADGNSRGMPSLRSQHRASVSPPGAGNEGCSPPAPLLPSVPQPPQPTQDPRSRSEMRSPSHHPTRYNPDPFPPARLTAVGQAEPGRAAPRGQQRAPQPAQRCRRPHPPPGAAAPRGRCFYGAALRPGPPRPQPGPRPKSPKGCVPWDGCAGGPRSPVQKEL